VHAHLSHSHPFARRVDEGPGLRLGESSEKRAGPEKRVGPARFSLAGRRPDPPRLWRGPAPTRPCRGPGHRRACNGGGWGVKVDVLLLVLPDRSTGLALARSGRFSRHSFTDAVA
jgi:hypothetical protein